MDSPKEESSIDNANRYRKFGLPNWMVNNIERLNFVTDFEQYACSPPETEGFLAEHIDNCDFQDTSLAHDAPESYCPVVIPSNYVDEKKHPDENPKSTKARPNEEHNFPTSPSSILASSPDPVISPVITNMMHEEFFSSPDTTPCPTPEPSPAPRRRMSGQQDNVQTNPGRWFYLGNLKKVDQKGQCLSINSNKENRKQYSDKSADVPVKLRDSPVKPKKDGIKLVISNFDINAISPSSW